MQLETPRLILRKMTDDDFTSLHAILSDPETMQYYPRPYDEAGVRRWIAWCKDSYVKHGFGLLAVVLKENGEFIGDCGISMQLIHGEWLPEIGYHIRKDCWRRGYASEAAAECIRYAFVVCGFPRVYSYMNAENVASVRTAQKNGMVLTEEYDDPHHGYLKVCAISREEWEARQKM